MSAVTYFADGQWKFTCALCGKSGKSGKAVKTWDNQYVCASHKEERNPQDFLRGIKENLALPWTSPAGIDQFVPLTCTLQGKNAVPGYAVPGCAVPGYINMAFRT